MYRDALYIEVTAIYINMVATADFYLFFFLTWSYIYLLPLDSLCDTFL